MPPAPPGGRYEDLIEVFTVLSRTLAEDESVHDTLQSILALALRLVPGCSAASVTVLDEQGHPATIAATDDDTRELDRRQYLLHDGPCLDAARRQQVNRWSLPEAEQRWPDFTSLAKEVGLRSYLAAGLSLGDQRLGALNLSSRDTMASAAGSRAGCGVHPVRLGRDRERGPVCAGPRPGGAAQPGADLLAVIDQAIGIMMAESKYGAEQSLEVLKRAWNVRRMKLRDLAAEIVTRVSRRARRGARSDSPEPDPRRPQPRQSMTHAAPGPG